jgi:transcriptional regulator with XRE-family HTH domain
MHDQYAGHMQELFPRELYDALMAAKKNGASLRVFREAAGISQRELARQIGERQSNIQYWETTGKIPRSDVLAALAKALGVTVEELLGEPKARRAPAPGGKVRQVFEAVTKLPRRQQQKIVEVVEALVSQHSDKAA